jgi:hypothetical protein
MTTQTTGLAIPHARRFSSRPRQRWHAVSLDYVLLALALIILLGFEFFPIFSRLDIRLDDSVANANAILKENAPK